MEPVLFYGNHAASSFGSIVALEWLGEPYRLVRLDLPFDAHSAIFTRVNPIQKVPTMLLADGSALSESAAILQHLAGRDPLRRLAFAPGSREQDHLNQVIAFLHSDFAGAFGPAFKAYDLRLTGERDGVAEEQLWALGRAGIVKAHADLERMLAENEWLAGSKRTIADAYFAGVGRWAPFFAEIGMPMLDPDDYPKLKRLHERLKRDPAVIFAQATEDGEQATSTAVFLGHLPLDQVPALLPR